VNFEPGVREIRRDPIASAGGQAVDENEVTRINFLHYVARMGGHWLRADASLRPGQSMRCISEN